MLKVSAVLCVCAAAWCSQAAAGGRSDGGNFLDDKQWLTTISQYDKEVGQWNKFRDHPASWSSLLEHVLSTGAKPSNKEVSSQEQHLQEGPGCWCRRSGSRFNRTLRLAEDSAAANTQNYNLHMAKVRGYLTASWALDIREVGIGSLQQVLLLAFPVHFCREMEELLCLSKCTSIHQK
ncbi:testican-3 isoform X8 [Oryctolagus cuniculus]